MSAQATTTTTATQHDAWRTARAQLYAEMAGETREGRLDTAALLRTREHFAIVGDEFEPQPYVLPQPSDGVGLICVEMPTDGARVCRSIGEHVVSGIRRLPPANEPVAYVNQEETMHLTVCHTSRPDELMPGMKARKPQEIAQLREIAARFRPFRLRPVHVLLTASGAVVMLFEGVAATTEDDDDAKQSEFAVDHLRATIQREFSVFPTKMPRIIWHSTLARILQPDVSQTVIDDVGAKCAAITNKLRADGVTFEAKNLWYLDETHHFWARGERTIIPLGQHTHE
ncbi:TPA: hypothetical protein N0F65_005474 [Lagenidium giganteum]|uniref:Uncharacterized protein n=1 Tax=Lagenidium giganteum TaxID=4803 RepID=A0AAV2Z1G0_9STRA|nr:TPA: hypothetical protein N0F65_005474 [Lagenidium giganteum]